LPRLRRALRLFFPTLFFVAQLLTAKVVFAQTTPPATNTVVAFGYGVGMLQAGDGNFYGIADSIELPCIPGVGECDSIYQTTAAGVWSVFHKFGEANTNTVTDPDSCQLTDLIVGTDGKLYGTCIYGGSGGNGTIFSISLNGPSGDVTTLASFGQDAKGNPDPGYQPLSLVESSDGDLYFTNPVGVYRLNPSGSVEPIYTFTLTIKPGVYIWPNGGNPTSIMQASDGNFYVTLSITPGTGGAASSSPGGLAGAIAQISPSGGFKLLHTLALDGSEGNNPAGPLVEDQAGNLYGMTGYSNNSKFATAGGVAFKITTSGQYTPLHSFTGGADGAVTGEGLIPTLILGSDGNLYGTTTGGGNLTTKTCSSYGCGTVFRLTTSGTLTTLHAFTGGIPKSLIVSQNPQVDGSGPRAPLVQTAGGYFYGIQTTVFSDPVVFKISLTKPIPSPVQLTFSPATVGVGQTTTLNWQVLNAFSSTAQQCGASVVGNPPGAGKWAGPQPGKLTGAIYAGSSEITPIAAGTYTFALTCGGHESGFGTLRVTGLEITTKSLTTAIVGQSYQAFLVATGGISPLTWAFAGTLPKGLTFSPAGELNGTPKQFGNYPLAFAVQDSSTVPQRAAQSYVLTVKSGLVLSPDLPSANQGKPYSYALKVTGGLKPYHFSLTSGTLPPGLKFNTSAGVISGTPEKAGTVTLVIVVSDAENPKATDQQSFVFTTIPPPLIITTVSMPNASVGKPYSASLAATGGVPPYSWSHYGETGLNNEVPPGLSISAKGILSGTPIQWDKGLPDYFAVQVTDSAEPKVSVTRTLAMSVLSTLKITTDSLPVGVVGVHLDVPLKAEGGVPPYTWTASAEPEAPNDIGLYIDDGVLEYQPIVAANDTVTLTVKDSEKGAALTSVKLPLIFADAPLRTTTTLASSSAKIRAGQSVTFTATVSASAGPAPQGQVTFYNGGATLGSATMDAAGQATFKTTFAKSGTFSITAIYSGASTYEASKSKVLTETVN